MENEAGRVDREGRRGRRGSENDNPTGDGGRKSR